MSRTTFITKSQAEMHVEADNMTWCEMMKENQTMVNPSETIAANENAVVFALCLMTATCKEESVNMVQGWRRAEQVWAPVWSAMANECGVGVAPPGMCSTCPITGSQWSRGGRESTSTSEDTVPNLDEQTLQYQIADVSRALNSMTEILSCWWVIGVILLVRTLIVPIQVSKNSGMFRTTA